MESSNKTDKSTKEHMVRWMQSSIGGIRDLVERPGD